MTQEQMDQIYEAMRDFEGIQAALHHHMYEYADFELRDLRYPLVQAAEQTKALALLLLETAKYWDDARGTKSGSDESIEDEVKETLGGCQ